MNFYSADFSANINKTLIQIETNSETNRGSEGKEKLLVVQSFIFAQNDLINSNLNADSLLVQLKKV